MLFVVYTKTLIVLVLHYFIVYFASILVPISLVLALFACIQCMHIAHDCMNTTTRYFEHIVCLGAVFIPCVYYDYYWKA